MDETQVVHLYIYTSIYRLIRLQDSTSLATDTRGEATQRAPKYRVVLDVELSHVPDLARCANKSGGKTHILIISGTTYHRYRDQIKFRKDSWSCT
jgi:hypothetical protein